MGARILIVEDNPANLELMTYLLSAFGHTVLAAEDGHTGLEKAACDRPDLIICDIQLPDVDGYEIVRRLNDDPGLRSIPLLAVTALAMVGDRGRVLAAGFDGYFSKPIDPTTFVQQVEGFLSKGHTGLAPREPDAPVAPQWDVKVTRNHTILVVDNLPVHLELARSILAPSGYNVITAGKMADGLALARTNVCHLILSDVCMSEGTGFDFLETVRADPKLRAIPFILITSTNMTEQDRMRGLALGAARYLRRPIEPEAMLAEIQACLFESGVN